MTQPHSVEQDRVGWDARLERRRMTPTERVSLVIKILQMYEMPRFQRNFKVMTLELRRVGAFVSERTVRRIVERNR